MCPQWNVRHLYLTAVRGVVSGQAKGVAPPDQFPRAQVSPLSGLLHSAHQLQIRQALLYLR